MELTKFMKVLMCFLVSCSNGGGHVSPVRTMVFCRNLLSFSSFVHFKIMWLTVCSSFILQEHVELGINLNLWRCDLVKPWPVAIGVNSAKKDILVFILSFIFGKNNLLTAPLVELAHCSCHFANPFSFPSVIIVSLGILSYIISPMPSVATFLARRSAISFPFITTCAFTQLKHAVHCRFSSLFISFRILSVCSVCSYSAICPVSLCCLCLPMLSFLHLLLTVDFVYALVSLGLLPVLPDY